MPMHLTSHTAPRRLSTAAALRPVARWSLAAIVGAWLLVAGQAHASVIIQRSLSVGLNNGLVGWWTFDGKDMSGVQAYDRSGNGNRGILESGPVIGAGRIGQGLAFDGTNDDVNLGNPSSLNLDTNFTISAWVKPTNGVPGTTDLGAIVAKTGFSNEGPFLRADCCSNGNYFTFRIVDAAGHNAEGSPASLYTPGIWYHVVMVVGARGVNGLLGYVNGVSSVSVDTSAVGTISSTRNWYIGFNQRNTAYCGCTIDDVRIYNRALSADEVKRLYNLGGTVKLNSTQNLNNNNSLQNGLVGWWTFDGKDMAGVQTYDRSGNGNRGILTNGPERTSGKISQGLSFDGVDDYVGFGDSLDTTFAGANKSFTMSAWINPKVIDPVNSPMIIGKAGDSNCSENQREFYWSIGTGNKSDFLWYGDLIGTTLREVQGSTALQTNTWYHIVVNFDSAQSADNKVSMFVNGIRESTSLTFTAGSPTSIPDGTAHLGLGKYLTSSGSNCGTKTDYFNGLLDDVRVYNRALSADEIKRLYNLGGTFKLNTSQNLNNNNSLQNGLVGWWTFDGKDMAGNYAFDKSGNANRGTLTGTNGVPQRIIGKIGQALNFDGVDDYVDAGDSSTLHMTDSTSMTFSAWIYPKSITVNGHMILRYDDGDNADGDSPSPRNLYDLQIYKNGSNNVAYFEYGPSTGVSSIESSVTPLQIGNWYHITAVRNVADDTERIYINGALDVSQTDTTTGTWETTGQALFIGRFKNGGGSAFFDGQIDDVRIYNRALSADEVKRLYNMGR